MKIGIAYSPDPVYMNNYIYRILEKYSDKIDFVICTMGSIIKKKKKIQQFEYFLALLLILGTFEAMKIFLILIKNKFKSDNRIEIYCKENSIQYFTVKSINDADSKDILKRNHVDLLFNQSHHILKKEVIGIPKIGVMNRHGALLPKYRGRLAPFWQLLNKEVYGGITYHLLDEKIDNGPIVWQQKILIDKNDNVITLIDKMFDLAVNKFGHVIDLLKDERWKDNLIENDEKEATYYSSPKLKDAIKYRFGN